MSRVNVLSAVCALLVLPVAANCQTQNDPPIGLKAGVYGYFTQKMENLTTQLDLTPEQRAKVKPIAEQEQSLYEQQIHANPVLSQKEKIKKLKAIVRDSDKRLRAILSQEQWQKLQLIRKNQQQELEALAQ